MFSYAEVQNLIGLPKRTKSNEVFIRLSESRTRIYLYSQNDLAYEFLVQIEQNKKIDFKFSFHHQEDNTKIGLLRVDFNGIHENPHDGSKAPTICKNFIGKRFTSDEPHVHIFAEGYKPLVWAIPLDIYGFKIIKITDQNSTEDAIKEFLEKINVVSNITIEPRIL